MDPKNFVQITSTAGKDEVFVHALDEDGNVWCYNTAYGGWTMLDMTRVENYRVKGYRKGVPKVVPKDGAA